MEPEKKSELLFWMSAGRVHVGTAAAFEMKVSTSDERDAAMLTSALCCISVDELTAASL